MLLHMCMCSITLSGGQLVHDRERERERDREWGARRGTRMKEREWDNVCVHVRV